MADTGGTLEDVGMKKTSISDQKRLVRGEHWIMARRILRARDFIHHGKWSVLIVAGPSPHEEITCIKELMPTAHITAVDINPSNVEAAKFSGADRALVCDLSNYSRAGFHNHGETKMPPEEINESFDVICLDLTGTVTPWLNEVVSVYKRALAKKGVLIVTFSYGRDVTEAYFEQWRIKGKQYIDLLDIEGMPDQAKFRIFSLLGTRTRYLQSCLMYLGKQMPMISCLMVNCLDLPKAKFEKITDEDFELAVTAENLGNIYACPQDRILSLRRSIAAKKAVRTKRMRQERQSDLWPRINGA
jgi:hypothetical protein